MPYLNSIGIQMPNFKNPADFILKLSQVPELISDNLSFDMLVN